MASKKLKFEEIVHDVEKTELFMTFLEEDGLAFLLQFWDLYILINSPNYRESDDYKNKIRRQAYKTFFRKREEKNFNTLVGRFGFEQHILDNIHTVNKKDTKNLPTDIFDEAYAWTVNYLEQTCFPNFLKSSIFIDSLSASDQNLSENCHSEKDSNDGFTLQNVPLEKIPKNGPPPPLVPARTISKPEMNKNESYPEKEESGSATIF